MTTCLSRLEALPAVLSRPILSDFSDLRTQAAVCSVSMHCRVLIQEKHNETVAITAVLTRAIPTFIGFRDFWSQVPITFKVSINATASFEAEPLTRNRAKALEFDQSLRNKTKSPLTTERILTVTLQTSWSLVKTNRLELAETLIFGFGSNLTLNLDEYTSNCFQRTNVTRVSLENFSLDITKAINVAVNFLNRPGQNPGTVSPGVFNALAWSKKLSR